MPYWVELVLVVASLAWGVWLGVWLNKRLDFGGGQHEQAWSMIVAVRMTVFMTAVMVCGLPFQILHYAIR